MVARDARTIETLKAENAQLREILAITEDNLRASQEEVLRLSTTDTLTGVFSRRHFMDLADQEISRARRYKRPLAVLVVVLDNMRAINDAHGTERGDAVLGAMGSAILRMVRTADVVGRTAGSEFTVLLPETEREGCIALADRVVSEMTRAASEVLRGVAPLPSVSLGATHVVRDDVIFDMAVRRADEAVAQARAQGGDRAVYLAAGA
ncbi:GGDEF domain-containing protein [Pararhodospirillum oryzae]|uniref:diguanylate cyclase n=1 Tax=Pararhodospirillum oryzae TaxID=478448 RepID=A0A512H8T2_9PROT|nr:GGDEF domain-containing protein [Pararhodospirillum oryzae]GEO81866.1 GGDEF domain-containing protein [Pararhodospirillum oryzae]